MKKTAYLYAAILNPDDDFWTEYTHQKDIRQSLAELKLFNVTQPVPLIFAVNEIKKEWLHKLLKMLVSISFRYNVIGKLNPNLLEKTYNKIAVKLYKNEISNFSEIKELLREVYVNDDTFVNVFKSKEIPTTGKNKILVKYILTKIENQIASKEYGFIDSNFTIEHILPENYDEEWNSFFSNEAEKYVYRLGNYTLLEEKKNRNLGRKSFEEKKKVYETSQFKLANSELNYDEWNIASLNNYQGKLARYAKSIWKI